MTDCLQVITTVASQADAQRIARSLIEERLAACVQIYGPIESVYRWEGKVETSSEWSCHIKAPRTHFDRLAARLNELHPYDVPEILAFPVAAGNEAYLEWVRAEVES